MSQTRYRRDGRKTIANTIYILDTTDKKAKRLAKQKSVNHKKVSKSSVLTNHLDNTL